MECGDVGSLKSLWRHLFSLLKPKAAENLESPEITRKRLCVCVCAFRGRKVVILYKILQSASDLQKVKHSSDSCV